MNQSNSNRNPKQNLEELKRQLESSQPVTVDQSGRLTTPAEVEARNKALSDKEKVAQTRVKPSRWFYR